MKIKREFLIASMAGLLCSCMGNDEPSYHYVYFTSNGQSSKTTVLYADQTKDTLAVVADSKCSIGSTYFVQDSTQVLNPNWLSISSIYAENITAAWVVTFEPNTSGSLRYAGIQIVNSDAEGAAVANIGQYPYLNISSVSMNYGVKIDGVYTVPMSIAGTFRSDSILFTVYDQEWTLTSSDEKILQLKDTKDGNTTASITGTRGSQKIYFNVAYNSTGADRDVTLTLTTQSGVENRLVFTQKKVENSNQ